MSIGLWPVYIGEIHFSDSLTSSPSELTPGRGQLMRIKNIYFANRSLGWNYSIITTQISSTHCMHTVLYLPQSYSRAAAYAHKRWETEGDERLGFRNGTRYGRKYIWLQIRWRTWPKSLLCCELAWIEGAIVNQLQASRESFSCHLQLFLALKIRKIWVDFT